MSMINSVRLIGNLGRDPEVRRTSGGEPVVSFSMAMTDKWTDKASGERKERTEWANVVIFNEHLCKIAEQYLKKGSKCAVEGEFRTREWEKDGVKRYSTDVVLQRFGGELLLLGDAGQGGRPAPDPDAYGKTKTGENGPDGGVRRDQDDPRTLQSGGEHRQRLDDDIPF